MVEKVDQATREAALERLLDEHPGALVAAVDPDRVNDRLPPSIHLRGQQVVLPRQALLLSDADSRPAVIRAWDDVHVTGMASTDARLGNGEVVHVHLVDVRERHGVIVGMVHADPGVDLLALFSTRADVVPKIGRTEKDAQAVIRHADDAICLMLGYEPSELVGCRTLDLVHPDDHAAPIQAWVDLIGVPGGSNRVRARHRRKDGTWLWLEVTNTNHLDSPTARVVSEMVDISEEMAALEALREREELLARLTDALPSGVLQLGRAREVVYANGRLHALLGSDPSSATTTDLLRNVDAWDAAALDGAIGAALQEGRSTELEIAIRVPGAPSPTRRCAVSGRTLTDADGSPSGVVLCFDDVTEAAELRVELERRATVDELTGCLNRAAVLTRLDELLLAAESGTAVVFIDLDGFKDVNDTFGHRAGDDLLSGAAVRLRAAMRPGDVVGRLGGDEFLVVLCDVASTDDAMIAGQRIASVLADPIEVAGSVPMRIRSSMGVAWTDGRARPGAIDADALTAAADRAMYQSKRAGACQPVYAAV